MFKFTSNNPYQKEVDVANKSLKLMPREEEILKLYMLEVLDSVEGKTDKEQIGILLNEIAAWKIYSLQFIETEEERDEKML